MQTQQKVEQLTAEINKVKLQKVLITLMLTGSGALWSRQPSLNLTRVCTPGVFGRQKRLAGKVHGHAGAAGRSLPLLHIAPVQRHPISPSPELYIWSWEQAREGRDSVVEAATAAWWLMGPSTTSFVKEALQIDGVMSFAPCVGQRPVHMTCEEIAAMPDADFNRLWQVGMSGRRKASISEAGLALPMFTCCMQLTAHNYS